MLFSTTTRAAQGARFLDGFTPGWADEIDPQQLDIADGDRCVLGQLYGHYGYGVDEIVHAHPSDWSSVAHGLALRSHWRLENWLLTRAWRRQVAQRLAAA
jgi:hypothetical protein